MNESYLELLKALAEVVDRPIPVYEKRVYYDEFENILGAVPHPPYPESENYIVVSEEEFKNLNSYMIRDKKLILIPPPSNQIKVVYKKNNHGYRVVKNHAALLLEENESYPEVEHYDRNY